MTEEFVFVVDRDRFFAGGDWPQGFRAWSEDAARARVRDFEAAGRFEPRSVAEENPAWKQLIPYCLVRCGAEWFCVQRLPKGGETRLHGKLSLGIGGHVNPEDTAGYDDAPLTGALLRELHEELVLPADGLPPARPLGLINDDSNAVGRVHTGLVFELAIPERGRDWVAVRERTKLRGGFRRVYGPDSLWQDRAILESWSMLLLEGLVCPMARRFQDRGPEGSTQNTHGRED